MNRSTLMTKRQVAEVLKYINEFYPRFEVTQSRIDSWSTMLKDQNHENVMKKAETHVKNSPFPPTIADLITVTFKKTRVQLEHEQEMREYGL